MAEQTISTAATSSTSTAASNARRNLRDMDELEGTILVPNARPVNIDGSSNNTREANPVVATALPTTYFQYDDDNTNTSVSQADGSGDMNYQAVTPLMVEMDGELNNNNNNNNNSSLPNAPAIPTYDPQNALKNSARDRQALKVGELKGKIDNEQQREDIQRANQKVASIEYFARQQVKQANQLARSLNRKEEANYVQTSAAMAERTANEEKDLSMDAAKKEPEFYEGTYGKEYDVSKYEVGNYDTSDYQVSEYKSVYE